jgi:hypothetical protein
VGATSNRRSIRDPAAEKDRNPGLDTSVEANPQWHRTGRRKVVPKAREEINERPLAAAEQPMHVPRLRRPASVRRVEREAAFQHHDMFKVVGEGACRGQAGHPGADHNRLPSDQRRRHLFRPEVETEK